MFKKKRGQVTSFIVIGIILLLIVGITVYMLNFSYKRGIEPALDLELGQGNLPSLDSYAKACIKKETRLAVTEIAKSASIVDAERYTYYDKQKINFLCQTENSNPKFSCVNSALTKQRMESELNHILVKKIDECMDLTLYTENYEVTKGTIQVNTKIAANDILVELTYPITLKSEESVLVSEKFKEPVKSKIGKAYELSQDIINSEITKNNFNIDKWQFTFGTDILIQKHRAYPHTIYLLQTDEFDFNFAIEGTDSVGEYIAQKEQIYGCCLNREDDSWFANTNPADCQDIGGDYNSDKECDLGTISNQITDNTCDGEICKNCASSGKKHGENWCIYDSVIGEGNDLVGSSSIKQTCVDGQVINEECRDYREELCVQEIDNSTSKALCRQNRWQSCAECKTKDCCINTQARDCAWIEGVSPDNIKNQCVPQVSPGLRFWEGEDSDVCIQASNSKECKNLNCEDFAQDNAQICHKMGDCGAYYNIEKRFTKSGYYTTDYSASINEKSFDIKSGAKSLNLPLQTSNNIFYLQKEDMQKQEFATLLSVWLEFIESISKIDPKAGAKNVQMKNYAFCNLYQAPLGFDDCSKCDDDKNFPCTEYRCKSLGSRCVFDYNEGNQICNQADIKDTQIPDITFDESVLSSQYSVSRVNLKDYQGYEVHPALKPYEKFTIGIIADEEVVCKYDLSPTNNFESLSYFYIGDKTYRQKQNITIRVPPKITFPTNIKEFISQETNDDFIKSISKTNDIYTKFKASNQGINSAPLGYAMAVIDKISSSLKDIAPEIIDSADKGSYYLFIKCQDDSLNENKEGFFIKINIDDNIYDNTAPIIEQIMPENNGFSSKEITDVKLYLHEPSECRYSREDTVFDEMHEKFNCEKSQYRINPQNGGTYLCQKSILTQDQTNSFFIRCRDNPLISKDYTVKISYSNQDEILYPKDYPAQLIDDVAMQNNTINLTDIALRYDIKLKVNEKAQMFNLKTADNKCAYSFITHEYDKMENVAECRSDNETNICSFIIETPDNESELFISCINYTKQRNENQESFEYTIKKSKALAIIDKYPKDQVNKNNAAITIRLNENIDDNSAECLISDNPVQGFIKMQKNSTDTFIHKVSDLEDNKRYSYFVYCFDKLSANVQDKIEFDAIII